jgi:hypothetical protein
MSLSSSTHDIENVAVECSSDGNYEEAGEDMMEYQTCAICLECIGSGWRWAIYSGSDEQLQKV